MAAGPPGIRATLPLQEARGRATGLVTTVVLVPVVGGMLESPLGRNGPGFRGVAAHRRVGSARNDSRPPRACAPASDGCGLAIAHRDLLDWHIRRITQASPLPRFEHLAPVSDGGASSARRPVGVEGRRTGRDGFGKAAVIPEPVPECRAIRGQRGGQISPRHSFEAANRGLARGRKAADHWSPRARNLNARAGTGRIRRLRPARGFPTRRGCRTSPMPPDESLPMREGPAPRAATGAARVQAARPPLLPLVLQL